MTAGTRRRPTVAVSTDPGPHGNDNSPTPDAVAQTVAGIPTIGEARVALMNAGWRATIAGNRITVNEGVFAQFFGAGGGVDANWVIFKIAGTPSVRVVGAEHQS